MTSKTKNNLATLQELWTFAGGDTKYLLDSTPLYTSEKLKEKYYEAISSHPLTKPIKKKIKQLLELERLVPAWYNRGTLDLTLFKIFAPISMRNLGSFYDPLLNVVIIMLDNNTKFLFYIPNETIAILTMHELMHYAAANNPTKFEHVCGKYLQSYYSSVIGKLLHVPPKEINQKAKDYSKELLRYETQKFSSRSQLNIASSIKKIILKNFSSLEGAEKVASGIEKFLTIYQKNPDYIYENPSYFKEYLLPLLESYRDVFGHRVVSTFVIQEYWSPSEVIAVLAEKASTKFPFVYSVL